MANMDKIVEVYISRETAQLETTSFNIPLLMVSLPDDDAGTPAVITQRSYVFTSLKEVEDQLGVDSVAAAMARPLLSGQNRPPQFVVGVKNSEETYTDALNKVQDENNSWYILMADTKVASNVLLIAAWIQAQRKMYATSTSDPEVLLATGDQDIGSRLMDMAYDRTFWLWHAQAEDEHPEAAWVGSQIIEVPGSNTWAFKQASGISVQKLTPTQESVLEKKNGSFFSRIAGVALFTGSGGGGKTAQGEWIDTMIGVDWLYARIQEQVFYRFATKKKIPMTQAGTVIIESEIRSVLSQGETNGLIADSPKYTVTSPNVLSIPEDQRARRVMGDFQFSARLAGAVHKAVIRGVVSY